MTRYFWPLFWVCLIFMFNYSLENMYLWLNSLLLDSSVYKSNMNVPDFLIQYSPRQWITMKIILNIIHPIINTLLGLALIQTITHKRNYNLQYIGMMSLVFILIVLIGVSLISLHKDLSIGNIGLFQLVRSPMIEFILIAIVILKNKK